jgi:hypothetical protein
MKKSLILSVILLLFAWEMNAQEAIQATPKKNQSELVNEIYAGYGIGSLFVIINNAGSDYSRTSPGTFYLGYSRYLTPVIAVGIVGAYTSYSQKNSNSSNGYPSEDQSFWQAMAKIQFNYLRRPSFAMYSGIAIGITYNPGQERSSAGVVTNSVHYYPAGQLSLLGFRIGRSGAFAGEFGVGTMSILNLGFSYKLGKD